MMQSSFYDSCAHVYNINILNLFATELILINTKSVIKNKLKDLLDELKKFKVQKMLVLENRKMDDHISMRTAFYSSAKLLAKDSDIDKAFGSLHQSVMTRIKDLLAKIGLFKQVWSMVLRFLSVCFDKKISTEKWRY